MKYKKNDGASRAVMSHPSRVRGLKLSAILTSIYSVFVAPLAGAWIEILGCASGIYVPAVAPLAGAWIEIQCSLF